MPKTVAQSDEEQSSINIWSAIILHLPNRIIYKLKETVVVKNTYIHRNRALHMSACDSHSKGYTPNLMCGAAFLAVAQCGYMTREREPDPGSRYQKPCAALPSLDSPHLLLYLRHHHLTSSNLLISSRLPLKTCVPLGSLHGKNPPCTLMVSQSVPRLRIAHFTWTLDSYEFKSDT